MAKAKTIAAVTSPVADASPAPEKAAAPPQAAKSVTYHVTCPTLGGKPFVTECGSRKEAEANFRKVCLGLSEDAQLSVTEA